SSTHNIQTAKMLERLDPVLLKEKPDVVLVPGDTNSTLAGSLAAYKMHIPNGHIEAVIRENTWRPEEINKKVADHCADFCFCPTPLAVNNLRAENIPEQNIFLTGDITYDAFLRAKKQIENGQISIPEYDDLGKYILLTMHRAETVDYYDKVSEIVDAILEIDKPIIYPMHPRSEKMLKKFGLYDKLVNAKHIKLCQPLGYYEFLSLLLNASLVMTDSGGTIKEAFYALKPCVTFDETSEYTEIFEIGYNILVGRIKDNILNGFSIMWDKVFAPPKLNPFGDGTTAAQIISILYKKQDILIRVSDIHDV
ncbi:MAG: UDP-GlcNAc3NAcA epimerase, partial [Candidatus Poribacteria bacterium]|nr:UDP-GlcNAc3NAcA epimerase [Candidatus Poribacteria bacterium]